MHTMPRQSDKYIPWYFVAFFVVLAVLDGFFVYLATSTQPGLVTEHAYQKGVAYNETIAQAEAQAALGWQCRITLEGKTLVLTLKDKDNAPITGAAVEASITRPTSNGHDFTVALAESAPGVYSVDPAFPMPGLWNIGAQVTWNQQHYQKSQRVVLQ